MLLPFRICCKCMVCSINGSCFMTTGYVCGNNNNITMATVKRRLTSGLIRNFLYACCWGFPRPGWTQKAAGWCLLVTESVWGGREDTSLLDTVKGRILLTSICSLSFCLMVFSPERLPGKIKSLFFNGTLRSTITYFRNDNGYVITAKI